MKKFISVLLVITSIFVMSSASMAATINVKENVETNVLLSSDKADHDYLELTTSGTNTLTLEGETTLPVHERLSVNVKKAGSSKAIWLDYIYPEKKGNYYYFKDDINVSKIPESGEYILMVIRNTGEGKTDNAVLYKNFNIRVTVNGGDVTSVKLFKYDNIIKHNQQVLDSVDGNPDDYTDVYLKDIKGLAFVDPVTDKCAKVTQEKVDFFKNLSDIVVKGATTDAEKAYKIYAYLADRFYYDDVAFQTGVNQYTDPYRNLYNIYHNVKSENSEGGKASTVCIGYSAATVALARAQGIPARAVGGHHISMGTDFNNWGTEKDDITEVDHWYAQVYIDGRWVTLDANAGSGNHWNKKTNEWNYKGLVSNEYFDPTMEQFSAAYINYEVRGPHDVVSRLDAPVIKADYNSKTGVTNLSWEPVKGATSYTLFVNGGGDDVKLITTDKTSYVDSQRPGGKTYRYKIYAYNRDFEIQSETGYVDVKADFGTVKDLATPKVKGVYNSKTKSAELSWDKVEGATSYSVYIEGRNGLVKLLTTNATSFVDKGRTAGKTYTYRVYAYNRVSDITSKPGYTEVRFAGKLNTPIVTLTSSVSTGKNVIKWKPVSDAVSYTIYVSTDNKKYSRLITTKNTSVLHSKGVAGRTYYYKVRANASVSSDSSGISHPMLRTCKLGRPSSVKAVNLLTTGKNRVTWKKVSGARKYTVYYSTSKNGTYRALATTTRNYLTHSKAVAGRTYYYKVKAIASRSSANSYYSGTVLKTCRLAAPSARIRKSRTSNTISWSKVKGASKYTVYYSTSRNGSYRRLITTRGTKIVHRKPVRGKVYYYKIKANASRTSADSAFKVIAG